jgi:hypothetical protein
MAECEQLPPSLDRYAARFARVLAHIEQHSEEAASIDELSGIAAFSRHHFHRQFSGYLGMSVYRYVQFMRMRRASWRLAFRPEMSVNEIALATATKPGSIRARVSPIRAPVTQRIPRAPDWPNGTRVSGLSSICADQHEYRRTQSRGARRFVSGHARRDTRTSRHPMLLGDSTASSSSGARRTHCHRG